MTTPADPTSPVEGDRANRRNAGLVATGIFLSRLAGFVREAVLALFLGVSPALDAFRAAFRIPNVLQNLLGEGSLSASFIPVYARLVDQGDEEEAGRVAGAVAGLLALAAGTLSVVGVVFAEPIARVLTPGFEDERFDLTVTLMRILTPGAGFLVLSAWCLGVLNSHRRFFLSYVAPVIWNAAQIAALVVFGLAGVGDRSLTMALAWGAFAGGVLQFAVQLPGVIEVGGTIRLSLDRTNSHVRDVIRRFWPALMGRGVAQLVSYVDILLASLLAAGAVAALGFAQILFLLPISLFGVSMAAAELPEVSRMAGPADGDAGARAALRRRIEDGLASVAFYVAFTSAVYLVAGDLLVGALFERGEFDATDTRLVWLVLTGYSVGLLATTSSRLLQNSFYALGDTRTPAVFATIRLVLSTAGGLLMMFSLDRVVLDGSQILGLDEVLSPVFSPLPPDVRVSTDGVLRLGAVGLSLAAGLSAWVEVVILLRSLNRRLGLSGRTPFRGVRLGGGQLGAALAGAAVASAVVWGIRLVVGSWPPLLAAPLAVAPAAVVYLAVTRALGATEADQLLSQLRERFRS